MKPPFSRTLFELVHEQAGRFPDRPAAICGERTATYRDLADGAGRIAASLRAHGVGRGERVGILVNNRLEWLESCLGATALGAVAVPFSTWSKPAELAYLLADSQVAALLAIDRFGDQVLPVLWLRL
jgi:fatty-acyl-CoA synthase